MCCLWDESNRFSRFILMGVTWQICHFFLVFEKFRIERLNNRQICFLSVSLANICKGLKKNYSVLNGWITSSEFCQSFSDGGDGADDAAGGAGDGCVCSCVYVCALCPFIQI